MRAGYHRLGFGSMLTLGVCNLHHRSIRVQIWGIYFLDPPGGLGSFYCKGVPMGPWCGPKGSELWAPGLKVFYRVYKDLEAPKRECQENSRNIPTEVLAFLSYSYDVLEVPHLIS